MLPGREYRCCRLCMCSSGKLLDIFSENSRCAVMVVEAIKDLLQVEVRKEDCLAWVICQSCLDQLSAFRRFKAECLRSLVFLWDTSRDRGKRTGPPSSENVQKKAMEEDGVCRKGKLDDRQLSNKLRHLASDINGYTTNNSERTDLVEVHGLDSEVLVDDDSDIDCQFEYCWCTKCRRKFLSYKELKAHMEMCRNELERSGQSRVESSRRGDREGKDLVNESVHFDPNLCCARCRKTFKSKERLVRHIEKYDFKCQAKRRRKEVVGGENIIEKDHQPAKLMKLENVQHNLEDDPSKGVVKERQVKFNCKGSDKMFQATEQPQIHDSSSRHLKCKQKRVELPVATTGNKGAGFDPTDLKSSPNMSTIGEKSGTMWDSSTVNDNIELQGKSSLGGDRCSSHRSKISVKKHGLLDTAQKDLINLKGIALSPMKRILSSNCNGSDDGSVVETSTSHCSEKNILGCAFKREVVEMESKLDGKFESSKSRLVSSASVLMRRKSNVEEDMCGNYMCDYCEKPHMTKPDLRDHIIKCHLSLNPEKCTVCHRLFTNCEELEEHMILHPKDKKFFCTVCDESFPHRTTLREHIMKQHDAIMAFVCRICNNGFTSRGDQALHVSLVHTESDKPFRCSVCGKGYSYRSDYNLHLKVCQLKTVSFRCDICGKEVSSKSYLNLHYLIHSSVRKYLCPICPQSFRNSSNRNIHVKSVHLNRRPHECCICGKRFPFKKVLRHHYISHSDERPFACPECPKSFKERRNVKYHLRSVHKKSMEEMSVLNF